MNKISSIKNNSYKILILFYILTMIIAFTTRYGDLSLGFHMQLYIGMVWIFLGFVKLGLNGFKIKGDFKEDFLRFLKLYMVPHLLIHLYTILLIIVEVVDYSYFTTNLTVYIPTLFVISVIYIIGPNVYKYTCVSLIISWVLSVLISFIYKGPLIFLHAIRQAYLDPLDTTGGLVVNYLELHDVVLAVGYIFVFNIYKRTNIVKKDYLILLCTLIILILGIKRIAILGIFLSILFYLIIRNINIDRQYNLCLKAGRLAFILCYLFIYLLSSGNLFYELISKYDVNVMGRNYYYSAIMSLAEFSPKFMGIGRNVITQLLNSDLSYLRVGGVHSDIIKMYVENGFILFGFWLWYNLLKITKFYKKYYGFDSAVMYFGIVIYTFTLYLTDNVEVYFICQIFAMMVPVTYALKIKELDKINDTIDYTL